MMLPAIANRYRPAIAVIQSATLIRQRQCVKTRRKRFWVERMSRRRYLIS